MIPMQSAERTKKKSRRQTNDLKALGRTFRGFSVSAATEEMYSGPHILGGFRECSISFGITYAKLAWMRQEMIPHKRPELPETRCSANSPF